jgi:hypothetical protein
LEGYHDGSGSRDHQPAKKHGFRLSGFRSFEKPVSEEAIERVREKRKELINQSA